MDLGNNLKTTGSDTQANMTPSGVNFGLHVLRVCMAIVVLLMHCFAGNRGWQVLTPADYTCLQKQAALTACKELIILQQAVEANQRSLQVVQQHYQHSDEETKFQAQLAEYAEAAQQRVR